MSVTERPHRPYLVSPVVHVPFSDHDPADPRAAFVDECCWALTAKPNPRWHEWLLRECEVAGYDWDKCLSEAWEIVARVSRELRVPDALMLALAEPA